MIKRYTSTSKTIQEKFCPKKPRKKVLTHTPIQYIYFKINNVLERKNNVKMQQPQMHM